MEDSSSPVSVGIVGLGGHGGTLQWATQEAPNLQVSAVFDLDESEVREATERFSCDASPSYEALLERDDLEAVVLVTPNHLHRAQTEAALAAGKHVLVEKPIANTVADGRAMVEAAEAAGRVLMVGHQMRRVRSARRARQYLEEGRLGEVASAEIHFSADNAQHLPEEAWRLQADQCPLLPVMQLGIHAIDIMHYLIGPVRRVSAQSRSVVTRPPVVDCVTASFEIEGGVTGTLVSNYCTPVRFDYRLAGTQGTLQCTQDRFWFRSAADTDDRGEGPAETRDFSKYDFEAYKLQMEAFGRAVRTGEVPETDGYAGLQALAVVEALQQSANEETPRSVTRSTSHV